MQNISSVVEVGKYIYTRGCIEAMSELIEPNLTTVSAVLVIFAVIQVRQSWRKFLKILFYSALRRTASPFTARTGDGTKISLGPPLNPTSQVSY